MIPIVMFETELQAIAEFEFTVSLILKKKIYDEFDAQLSHLLSDSASLLLKRINKKYTHSDSKMNITVLFVQKRKLIKLHKYRNVIG